MKTLNSDFRKVVTIVCQLLQTLSNFEFRQKTVSQKIVQATEKENPPILQHEMRGS